MEITRATEYAVRCVLHLALQPPDRVVPRREIARVREIPEQFLGKIAQRLARAGILRIHQGARGGYELAIPAERLTLLDVVEAAEGALALNTCVMNARVCSRTCGCAAHRVWAEARRQLRATLSAATFADLAAQEASTIGAAEGGTATEQSDRKSAGSRRRGGAERGPPAPNHCRGTHRRGCAAAGAPARHADGPLPADSPKPIHSARR